jgi:pimeloyl-ACP methyl ester carboxylesterase
LRELPELPGGRHSHHALPTGVTIHVAEAGPPDGPAVLALHCWPQHWWCWRRVIPLLAGSHRVIAPDNRGFGWSSPPADGDYRKDRIADDALALLDALGLERAYVLGHDWGGWVGFLLALRAPERVSALLALSTAHPWPPRHALRRQGWRFVYQPVLGAPLLGPRLVGDRRFLRQALYGGFGDRGAWDESEMAAFLDVLPRQARASSALYRAFVLRESDPRRFAGLRLRPPARLLVGDRDTVLHPDILQGLERHAEDASLELVPGAGHFLPEERPELVAERARALFA